MEVLVLENADVAQLVEHTLGKGEVTGSIPVVSSEKRERVGTRGESFGETLAALVSGL